MEGDGGSQELIEGWMWHTLALVSGSTSHIRDMIKARWTKVGARIDGGNQTGSNCSILPSPWMR